jgi:hypothetical protein
MLLENLRRVSNRTMTTKKQRREAVRIKRERREAEAKASGLQALAEDRKRRAGKGSG